MLMISHKLGVKYLWCWPLNLDNGTSTKENNIGQKSNFLRPLAVIANVQSVKFQWSFYLAQISCKKMQMSHSQQLPVTPKAFVKLLKYGITFITLPSWKAILATSFLGAHLDPNSSFAHSSLATVLMRRASQGTRPMSPQRPGHQDWLPSQII